MPAKFIPLGDRILVSIIHQDKIIEGVLLPDSTNEDMQVGAVLAVGDGCPVIQVGEHILCGKWAGKDIQIEGIPFRVLRFEEIDGKVVTE